MMKFERLGNLVNIQIGKTPKREVKSYWGKGHPWVSIADLKGREIYTTKEQITDLAVKECGCKLIEKGTLLLSFKLSIGKLAFAGTDLYTNEAICGLKIIDNYKVFPKYLFYALKAVKFGGSNAAAKGATLNTASLNALKIPLPDTIEDQIRIATVLEKAEKLVSKQKKAIELLDEFLKSTFLKMFGHTRNYSTNDTVKTIEQVCNYRGGGTPSKSNQEYYKGDIPWVSPKDMKWLYITTSQDKITQLAIEESSTALIPKGSLLMVIRSGILKTKLPLAINVVDVAINQDMKAFSSQELATEYLLYYFKIEEKNILKKVKGTTADNLNFDDIKKLKIKVPPIELQDRFVQIVEKTEAIKVQFRSSLLELENLYKSLSQKAFKGELFLGKLMVEYKEEYSASDNDRTEPKQINFEKVSVRPKRIHEMSLDEHYGIPEEIVAEFGSIETKVVDWPFFLKKHFSDRPVKIDDLAELFNRIYYEEGLYFKYDEFKEFLFEELKKDKPFLKQGFNEETKQLELTIIHETSEA